MSAVAALRDPDEAPNVMRFAEIVRAEFGASTWNELLAMLRGQSAELEQLRARLARQDAVVQIVRQIEPAKGCPPDCVCLMGDLRRAVAALDVLDTPAETP